MSNEHPYFRKMGWPRFFPQRVEQGPGGEHKPDQQQTAETATTKPSSIGSRPKDSSRRVWQVHDIFAESGRVDKERLVSEHAKEQDAKDAGSRRAIAYRIPYHHHFNPGPYSADTAPPTPPTGSEN